MKLLSRPPLVVAAMLLGTATASLAQDVQLTPEEVKATLVGKKMFGRTAAGGLVDFSMRADGTASVSVGNTNDSGTWRLNETGYCATWQQIRNGKEGCFVVVRRGTSLAVLNPDGSLSTQVIRLVD